MSTLLSRLGRWSFRHPWRVLGGWLLALVLAGSGALLLGGTTDNSFSIPGTEAQEGLAQLSRSFPQVSGTNAQFIVVAADGDAVTDSDYREPIEAAVTELSALRDVLAVTSPYDELIEGMISDDSAAAIVQLQFNGQATDISDEVTDALRAAVAALDAQLPAGSVTSLGGDLFALSMPTITPTEGVGLLIALVVLIVTFGSFVVAGLPLLTAILGVGISMAGIFAAAAFATISSTTPLLALMLGLAVGIDYALFIVARHQDQVRGGMAPEESAARAVGTAGSAVVFAGITVIIALVGLGLAGIPFLTTMGVAASVAVAIAVAIAVTLTPALLGFVGARVAGRPRRARRTKKAVEVSTETKTNAWVRTVTRRPLLATVAVVVGLGALAIPATSLSLALPNAGVLPQDSEARQSYDLVSEHFGPGFNGPLIMTGTIVTSTDPLGLMQKIGDDIATLPGVAEVALATPNETADTGIVQIIPTTAPDDPATSELVRELRAQRDRILDEYGVDMKVTGFTAVAIDISDKLAGALVPFGVFVIGLSLVLLTIVFRSIWVPITAAAGYLLSILAAFGVVAIVFEWGVFADLLHVARTGPIISFMPIVLMGVLFGLAMDYQVFLVSRMREDFVHSATKTRDAALRAVQTGFTSSARVVTAAALIMFAVFVAFVPEGDSSIKPIALGLAAGIAIDAFLVRMTLIPAVMALLGERAWQIPAWLERVLPHVDIEGEAVERERMLASWPGDDSLLAADDLVVPDADPVSLRVSAGDAVVLEGEETARRALALALSGRTHPDAGQLRVIGHLLPGHAGTVRRRVGLVLVGDTAEALTALHETLASPTPLLVVDGLDRFTGARRDQLVALLRDRALSRGTAIIAGADDTDAARGILREAGWPASDTVFATTTRRTVPAIEVSA